MRVFAAVFLSAVFLLTACNGGSEDIHAGAQKDSVKAVVKDSIMADPFKEGEEIIKYDNGVIKIKGTYRKGKREGVWMSWYSDGKPWSENFYENGLKNGKTITYYENGKVRYEGFFKDDRKSGNWKYYDESGKLVKEELISR